MQKAAITAAPIGKAYSGSVTIIAQGLCRWSDARYQNTIGEKPVLFAERTGPDGISLLPLLSRVGKGIAEYVGYTRHILRS